MPFGIYQANNGKDFHSAELFIPVPYIRYARLLSKNLELGAGGGYHYYIFNAAPAGYDPLWTKISGTLLFDIMIRYNFEISKRWGLFLGGGPVGGIIYASMGPGSPHTAAVGFKTRAGASVWVSEWARLNMGLEYQMGWWNGQQWNAYYLPNFFLGVDFGF